jgi:hypothetical protein
VTVARHCPSLFSGDLILVTDAWLVPSASAHKSYSYLEVARCHTIISAVCAAPLPQLPLSPSHCSSCRGSVDAITSASTASGRPSALLRVCDATFSVAGSQKSDYKVACANVVLEHEAALTSLSWARCSSAVLLNDLKLKSVSGVGRVYYSTPSTRCTLPANMQAPPSCESALTALYSVTITACLCSGV